MTPTALNFTIAKGITWAPDPVIIKDDYGEVIDLTGYSVFAQARVNLYLPVLFSLAPTITDATAGEVTFAMTDEQTALLPDGACQYDLVIENPAGERLGPYFAGTIVVGRVYTRA